MIEEAFDDNYLVECGLGDLPNWLRPHFLEFVYETFELRVGDKLSEGLTNEQLDEFESIFDSGTPGDERALEFLQLNVPQYKETVAEMFQLLKLEIKVCANDILKYENG